MRLTRNAAETRIADEVRTFLATHTPPRPRSAPYDFDERIAWLREWQGKLHGAGLVNVAWPKEHGGRGATLREQMVVEEELARADAPELDRRRRPRRRRPFDRRAWDRRAEGAMAAEDPQRRGDLVSGLLGAGRRLGPCRAAHRRRGPRGSLGRPRPEDLDVVGAVCALVRGARHAPTSRRRHIAGSRISSPTCSRRASTCARSSS